MEDIHDIYDPIITSTFNIYFILIPIIIILLGTIIFIILKKRKNQEKSPFEIYTNALDSILDLKKKSEQIESKEFSTKAIKLFIETINSLIHTNFASNTTLELIHNIQDLNLVDNSELTYVLEELIEKSIYGKREIDQIEKTKILDLFSKIVNSIYMGHYGE